MTFSKNHWSKRGLNLITYSPGVKYGERPGRSELIDLIKWKFQNGTFFFAHPLMFKYDSLFCDIHGLRNLFAVLKLFETEAKKMQFYGD